MRSPLFQIRDKCFRPAAASPQYVVHHFRHPGGWMEFTIEDEISGQEYHLSQLFIHKMLASFFYKVPPPEQLIQHCIDEGAIPPTFEEYIY